MNRPTTDDDDWEREEWASDADGDGGDDWEEEEEEDDDEEPTVPCPYCRREIHEEAERCPYCERYISSVDAPQQQKPWWILIGAAVCLYLVYRWTFG